MPDQMQLTPMSLEADDKPSLTPAAVHQSAVFAALFEDMIASQSCDALLHVQTSPAASNHSSAVSLCDSAASFSFKTAMRNQNATEAAVLSSTLQPHFVAQQPVAAGLPDAGETHLSFTLKDWQTDADCKSACTLTEALLQPATTEKAVAASQAHRSCGPQIFHCQATQGLHSTQQAGFNVTPTPDMKAGSVRDGPRVSHASECVPASAFSSKRARGKSGAAQRQGAYSAWQSTQTCIISVRPDADCSGWLCIRCILVCFVVCTDHLMNCTVTAVGP